MNYKFAKNESQVLNVILRMRVVCIGTLEIIPAPVVQAKIQTLCSFQALGRSEFQAQGPGGLGPGGVLLRRAGYRVTRYSWLRVCGTY